VCPALLSYSTWFIRWIFVSMCTAECGELNEGTGGTVVARFTMADLAERVFLVVLVVSFAVTENAAMHCLFCFTALCICESKCIQTRPRAENERAGDMFHCGRPCAVAQLPV
jgi:hypothetical protein